MIVNVIFHGAWVFMISEKNKRIFAYAPDEAKDHKYGVGSITKGTFAPLPRGDYEFLGVVPGSEVWYPNSEYTPVISAKRQGLKSSDPKGNRYCYISLPFPQPVNIFPLEPYDTVSFLKGKASSEVANLKQFPAVHCFVYQFSSLSDLQFKSRDNVVVPDIPFNRPPYQNIANLHVLATYWAKDPTSEDDKAQMERCFDDMTSLFDPKLDLILDVESSDPDSISYVLPPGVITEEVELRSESKKIGIFYGPGHNCQNASFFLNETDSMQLP